MLEYFWRSMGERQRSGMSGALGALDEVVNPGAARARLLTQAENERVIATPSPGDRLLDEGIIVIDMRGQ